jgi:hypothetical protein
MPTYFWVIISIIVALLVIVIASIMFAKSLIPPPQVTTNTSGVTYNPQDGGATAPAPSGTSGSYLPEASTQSAGELRASGNVDIAQPVVDAVRNIVSGIQTSTDKAALRAKINRTTAPKFPTTSEVQAGYTILIDQKIKAGESTAQLQAEFMNAKDLARYAEQIRMIIASGYICGRSPQDAQMLGDCTTQKTTSPLVATGKCPAGWTEYTTSSRDPAIVAGQKRCVQAVAGKTAKHLIIGSSYQEPVPNKYVFGAPVYGSSMAWMTYM